MPEPPRQPGTLPNPDRLPHGPGFRFVSEVHRRVIGENGSVSGEGLWRVRGDEAFLEHHFPGEPIVPGVLVIEALAQFSGLIHFGQGEDEPPARAGIARADVVLKRPIAPPADIALSSVVRETTGPLTNFSVAARVEGRVVARGEILLTHALKG
ncbi:MAG: hypothetical protein AAF663_01515 [Planctomycetota bacterium]